MNQHKLMNKHNSNPSEHVSKTELPFIRMYDKRNSFNFSKNNHEKNRNSLESSNDVRISSTTKAQSVMDRSFEPSSTTNGQMLPPSKFQSITNHIKVNLI